MMSQRAARKTFKGMLVVCGAALLSLLVGSRADAATLNLVPDSTCTSNDNANFDAAQVLAKVQACFGAPSDPLSLLYKADQGDSSDEGTYGSSYDTTFSNTSSDPQDATILHLAGTSTISCSACYLVVKDGNQTPAQYFYDITGWNGSDTIQLTGFWPKQGAISNVAIWGPAAQVPEAGSLLLFGTGLGFVAIRRRRLA